MPAVVLVAVVALAAALPTQAAAAPRTSKLIVSPNGDALVTGKSVRVVIRRRSGTRTQVRIGRRDVTKRFRVSGRQLVGRLSRRTGLRYGRNPLSVVSRRGGKVEGRHARSFFFLRHNRRFLRVRLRGGNPARLRIDVRSGGSRLALARRPRTVRVRLNGRLLGRDGGHERLQLGELALGNPRPAVRRQQVAPVHRRAADRPLRIDLAAVPGAPHPAARGGGLDRVTRPKVRVRLGGRHRAARGGRLRYRWTLVKRPRGSRARIRGRTRARPVLVPDREGRYVARVRVSEHKLRARIGVPGHSVGVPGHGVGLRPDNAGREPGGVTAFVLGEWGPRRQSGGSAGRAGSASARFYKNPGPPGTIQWLEINRNTREVTNSTYCCTDDGAI